MENLTEHDLMEMFSPILGEDLCSQLIINDNANYVDLKQIENEVYHTEACRVIDMFLMKTTSSKLHQAGGLGGQVVKQILGSKFAKQIEEDANNLLLELKKKIEKMGKGEDVEDILEKFLYGIEQYLWMHDPTDVRKIAEYLKEEKEMLVKKYEHFIRKEIQSYVLIH